ncbi:hypothetical protein A8B73_00040 [Methylosinus sp. 3S-1]|nr:hypothetical protein A8B73_00040 [Methylosinus sp. 3S-1]
MFFPLFPEPYAGSGRVMAALCRRLARKASATWPQPELAVRGRGRILVAFSPYAGIRCLKSIVSLEPIRSSRKRI